MAVKSRDELLAQVKARIGDDTSDEAIALIEDFTDTLSDLETKANGDGEDWKSKYEQNDKEWREKYIARFNGSSENDDTIIDELVDKEKSYRFEDLFK